MSKFKEIVTRILKENGIELEETKPSRFNTHLDNYSQSFAIISPERNAKSFDKFNKTIEDTTGNVKAVNNEKNAFQNRRMKKLKQILNTWNLTGYIKTRGGYEEIDSPRVENEDQEENSLFIPNITKEQAIKLGKIFNQDTILYKPKNSNKATYIITNKSAELENDAKIGDETQNPAGPFYLGQGKYNINSKNKGYSRPLKSKIKFPFNTEKIEH